MSKNINKPYTLQEYKRFMRNLKQGKISSQKLKFTFERAAKSLKVDLDKLTVKQLLRRCHFTPTRYDFFQQAYELCLMKLALGRVICQEIYRGESFVEAVRRQVYNIDDKELQQRIEIFL